MKDKGRTEMQLKSFQGKGQEGRTDLCPTGCPTHFEATEKARTFMEGRSQAARQQREPERERKALLEWKSLAGEKGEGKGGALAGELLYPCVRQPRCPQLQKARGRECRIASVMTKS